MQLLRIIIGIACSLLLSSGLEAAPVQIAIRRPLNNELIRTSHDLLVIVSTTDAAHDEYGRLLTWTNVTATCEDNWRNIRTSANFSITGPRPFVTSDPARVPADLLQHCSGHRLTVLATYGESAHRIELRVTSDLAALPAVIVSSLSICSCLVVIAGSLLFPVLRRFPSSIIFWRTCCELLFDALVLNVNSFAIDKYGIIRAVVLAVWWQFGRHLSLRWDDRVFDAVLAAFLALL